MSESENVIPEAAVEAAAKAIWDLDRDGGKEFEDCRDGARRSLRREAHAALEAAAPHIAAKALEDAADAFEDLPVNKGATISTGTSDWFELFPIQHIRDRAADLRK